MNRWYGCVLFVVAALSGCAVNPANCDPRNADAGFSTKFGCKTQGVYEQRIVEREQILLDEQHTNRLFREIYAAIEAERQMVGRELEDHERRYESVDRALSALLSELRDKGRGNQRLEAEISQLETQMRQMRQQDNPAIAQRQIELQQLRGRVAELESDLGLR